MRAKHPPVERSCQRCGTTFKTWRSEIVRGKGKYCSRGCIGRRRYVAVPARPLRPYTNMCPKHFATGESCIASECLARHTAFEQLTAALWAYWSSNERRLYEMHRRARAA